MRERPSNAACLACTARHERAARPSSCELPVDGLPSPLGLPVLRLVPFVCMPSPIPRQDPWDCPLVLSHRLRLSLDRRRVSSCITCFGACTAFTSVRAYILSVAVSDGAIMAGPKGTKPPLIDGGMSGASGRDRPFGQLKDTGADADGMLEPPRAEKEKA